MKEAVIRRPLLSGCLATVLVFVAIIAVLIGPYDWAQRYLSWRNLTKAELVAEAQAYVDDRALGNRACLYAVVCKDGRAGLELIKSVDDWDIEAARQLAWERRFSRSCPGQTANFALRVAVDEPLYGTTRDHVKYGVWSFANDRFVPSFGRFHAPLAFSELPTEECTVKDALRPGRPG